MQLLGTSRTSRHLGVRLHHERQLADELTVRQQLREGSQIHIHLLAPREDDVQVRVRDGELAAHHKFLSLQHVLLQILELGGDFLVLRNAGVAFQFMEQRAIRSVHLAGQVVQNVLNQVSVTGAILRSDGARSLMVST